MDCIGRGNKNTTAMRNKHTARALLAISVLAFHMPGVAQSISVEEVTSLKERKAIKINGGVSANTTVFNSNERTGRQAFTYSLNGNLHLSLMGLANIPLTFSLNNYGAQFTYPTLPNRLSLHPSYKWARCHIGDVSMAFSPYTLNGHQFTGAGVELAPGKWAIQAMGGRLSREVGFNPALPRQTPAYSRYGYGVKTRYDGEKFFIGGTVFTAKDHIHESSFQADSLGIYPKSNVALSLEGGISVVRGLRLSAEYAASVLTRDTRSPGAKGGGFLERLLGKRESTSLYHAVKASLEYTLLKNTVGVGYERVSPQYETLGAYYFNNGYENMTLNYNRPLFGDKASISLSAGAQREGFGESGKERSERIVGSIHFTYSPTDRLAMSLDASTFQGYRNIKSRFDYVNQVTPYENLDTLEFSQISRNMDLNLDWSVSRGKRINRRLAVSASYQEAADKQGEYILPGNLTRLINLYVSYGIEFISANISVNAGFNLSNDYSGMRNFLTLGPTVSVNVALFRKTLVTGLVFSCNRSRVEAARLADVYNCRWNAAYGFLKRHSLRADLLFQQREPGNAPAGGAIRSLTSSFSYSYSF